MTRFARLVEAALEEFSGRLSPVALPYLLTLPSWEALQDMQAFQVACALFGTERAKAAFEEGFALLECRGATRSHSKGGGSHLTRIMAASILDALAVREGELDLDVSDEASTTVETGSYGNRRYLAAGHGQRAIIIVNALGVSYHCWDRLARVGIPDHRLILFESRSSDIESGGVKDSGGIDEDIDDLLALIDHERLDQPVLLSWCSGARTTMEFALRHPKQLGQLVLLAPTLCRTQGLSGYASPFEDNLDRVLKMVNGRLPLAQHFVQSLAQAAAPPSDEALTQDLENDAALFLNLPRRQNAALVMQPFADGHSLLNYGKRIAGDISAMTIEKLTSLSVDMLLIQGDRDNVVNNQLAFDVLRNCRRPPAVATIIGAGHYSHDLQHHYFRKVMIDFIGARIGSQPCARIAAS